MENEVFKKILEWAFAAIVALAIALIIRYYLVSPAAIMQESMHPTLEQGERIILSRLSRVFDIKYERGDIVTFEAPKKNESTSTVNISNPIAVYEKQEKNLWQNFKYNVLEIDKISYIKRIIGVEGDTIHIEENGIYVNGEKLNYDYLQNSFETKNIFFNDIVVPTGYVFVMGDNASESLDSRNFGCIPMDKIEGKVIFRYWPYNNMGKVI